MLKSHSGTSQESVNQEGEGRHDVTIGSRTVPKVDVVVSEEVDSVKAAEQVQVRLLESRVKELEEALAVKTTEVNVINVQLKEANEKLLKFKAQQDEEKMEKDTQEEVITPKTPALLTYLPKLQAAGITDLLLEFINTGESGPQSVLNLRKVHRDTKDWIDTLRPALQNRIFFRIPIKFSLDDGDDDLKSFHECPPPPSATSMILYVPTPRDDKEDKPYVIPEERKAKLIQTREDFPTFFTFWTKRMQTLQMNGCYSSELLDVLGSPSCLRNLDCEKIFTPNPPLTLFQVEILRIYTLSLFAQASEQELLFYRQLADNLKLKRLRISIRLEPEAKAQRDRGRNLLEGVQLLVESRRNDANFELVMQCKGFDLCDMYYENDDDDSGIHENGCQNLRRFVSSVAASASSIRIFGFTGEEINIIQDIFGGSESDSQIARAFLKRFEKIKWVEEVEDLGRLLDENTFPNLSYVSADIPDIRGADNVHTVALPNSLEYLGISSHHTFLPMMFREIRLEGPELLLKAVHVDLSGAVPGTVEEWIEALTTLSQGCPLLNKLSIDNFKVSNSELYNWKAPEENIPQYSFSNLKSLRLSLEFVLDEELQGWGSRVSTSNLLLHVFQIQQMSLLKFILYCKEYPIQLVIDADCVESLLNSRLAKSLVSTNLDWYIPKVKREVEDKFLAVVDENWRQRVKKLGRQGRRQNFFDFDIHSAKWWK